MVILGRIVGLPRKPWFFRSKYQPQRLLQDAMFILLIILAMIVVPFFLDVAIGAMFHKEPCSTWDAKHNIGIDPASGKLCRRRPGKAYKQRRRLEQGAP